MRGADAFGEQLFTIKRPDEFIPANHSLRPVWAMISTALQRSARRCSAQHGVAAPRPAVLAHNMCRHKPVAAVHDGTHVRYRQRSPLVQPQPPSFSAPAPYTPMRPPLFSHGRGVTSFSSID